MNDNFENQFNPSEPDEPVTDETVTSEPAPEETASDPMADETEFGEITAQKINIPEENKPAEKVPNKGLRVFCFLLASVMVLSCFSLGGYFIGRHTALSSTSSKSGTVSSLEFESRPADAAASDITKVYDSVADSVVGILIYNDSGKSGEASGVVYSKDGYIITNDHIYSEIPSAKFKVFLNDGSEYDAHYVAGDTRSDLAVLKISSSVSLTVPTFGNSDEVVTGEAVCAIGCPNGYSARSTVTSGIVSVPKVRMSITTSYSSNFIQTDTAINPGNSGGALVNMYGQIIGITSSKISGTAYEGVGFAIPSATVKKVAESLIENGNVKNRARLGISYYFYNSAMAELNDMPSCGLLVGEVASESDLYGTLREGDMITRVNDIELTDDAIILDILEGLEPGNTILLTVIRESGETVNLSAVLLADEGSSSYVNSESSSDSSQESGGSFDWPEGY